MSTLSCSSFGMLPRRESVALGSDKASDAGALEDRRWFESLVRELGPSVFAYCRRVTRSAALAEDAMQQVFEQAYRDRASLADRSRSRAWLLAIAHHRCLDALRARRRLEQRIEVDTDVDAWPSEDDPHGDAGRGQLRAALEACLERISPAARAAILLRFQSELSYEEMAARADELAGTLQARVVRALPVLRKCLASRGVGV